MAEKEGLRFVLSVLGDGNSFNEVSVLYKETQHIQEYHWHMAIWPKHGGAKSYTRNWSDHWPTYRHTLDPMSRKPTQNYHDIYRIQAKSISARRTMPVHAWKYLIGQKRLAIGAQGDHAADDHTVYTSTGPEITVSHCVGLRVHDPGSIPSSPTHRLVRVGLSAHNASRRRYRSQFP
jgi:hypothetical protein